MEDKRDQLEKKGSRRFRGAASRMRHSTIAKVTPGAPTIEVKEAPRKRSSRAKSLLLSKPTDGWRRSARGGFEKQSSKSKLGMVDEDYDEFDIEEEESARELEQEHKKDEKERRFDSWLHEVLDEEESAKQQQQRGRGLDKAKSQAAISKAESILGLGDSANDADRRGSGINDGWLGDFLGEGYHKTDKHQKKGDEMQLDFSILENYNKDAESTEFMPPPSSTTVTPPRSSGAPASRGMPLKSPAAIEQSKRNLAMEKYIEENTQQLLQEHQHLHHHHHHRHDGHHGHKARKHKTSHATVVKPELGRDTTT